jgi:hypothetical protein
MLIRYLLLLTLLIQLILPLQLTGQESASPFQSPTGDSSRLTLAKTEKKVFRTSVTGSIEQYVRTNESLPSEKIYLHLDRTTYLTGDTIWFKGYSWYGYEQTPDTVSRIMYVDLLDQNGKIKLSRKLLIGEGTSAGDFCLDTTIVPGNYIIRAYTRWMQNMNTGEPFYQNIKVKPTIQNFQVECKPVILRHEGHDTLNIGFLFFEMDPSGNLRDSFKHKVNYNLKIGEQLIDSGHVTAGNTIEQTLKKDLTGIDKNAIKAIFELSVNDKTITFKKQFEIPIREGIDIQFFPEGGTLVNGIKSKIVFKAVGTDGLGRDVKGVIESEGGDTITGFASSHKGMGSFILKPESLKKYYAHLLFNKRNYVIPLPSALEKGCVMTVYPEKEAGNLYLNIKCSPSEIAARKYVTGSTNGKIWFSALVKMTVDSVRIKIPTELLPEGICRLTVLSDDFKPECERLIYNDNDERFMIDIKPDSSSYGTRSRATLLIVTKDVKGKPVQTDLSLAIVDNELVTHDATVAGICAYKLLESDLKGNIEDAGYYFMNGKCSDYESLDLLLLSQGYRKFVWRDTIKKEQKFQPETNLYVSGNVILNGNKSRLEKYDYRNIDMTLFCKAGKTFVNQTYPDSTGRFSFQIPLLFGKSQSILQAKTLKGKKINGKIYLEEMINTPGFSTPLLSDINFTTPVIENVCQVQNVIKTVLSKDPSSGYMSRNLPEVVVKAKAKNWYLNYEKEAIKTANLDSLDPQGDKYESLPDLLIREFGARRFIIPNYGFKTVKLPVINFGSGDDYYFPVYIVNGSTWFDAMEKSPEEFIAKLKMISYLHVNEIKKLMVLPPGGEIIWHYTNPDPSFQLSLVVIETYNKGFRGDPQGIQSFILEGLDSPRQFYSPVYDENNRNSPVYDGRATLLWNPSVRTDVNGEAKIDFFTSDRRTNFDVIVNGTEIGSGNPGQRQININSTTGKNIKPKTSFNKQ